jgi:hypothetical protein
MFGTVALASTFLVTGFGYQDVPMKDKKVEQLPIPKGVPDEVLPAPRAVMPEGMIVPQENLLAPYASHMPQLGTREVWQYYGVDSTGRFRPRVIYSPGGAFYAINGQPYPWTTNRPHIYMPYAVD